MKLQKISALLLAGLCLAACGSEKSADETARTAFFDLSGMDSTTKPGDNFFLYANGKWMKKTVIPGDQTGWGSFYQLYDENQKKIKAIIDEAAKTDSKKGTPEQKVGDLYASGMDTLTIEKLGYEPIKPTLQKIAAIKDSKQLLDFLAANEDNYGGSLFGFSVGPDDKNSTKNRVQFSQVGLNLPEKDYYLKQDPESKKIRDEYQKYIAKVFTLTGTDSLSAQKQAAEILALETLIAKSHKSQTELRDPVKNYHKFAVSELNKVISIDWNKFLESMKIKTDTILMGQPEYYTALGKLLNSTPVDVFKNKEKFSTISNSAYNLSKPFRDARFDFYGKVLNGQQTPTPRWKRIVDDVDSGLGELLGQLFVKKYFTPEAKQRMLTLVENLQKVYRGRIEKLDWMSPETKQKALVKLDKFSKKIGYPDKWKNYDDVEISKDRFFENMRSIAHHDYKEMIAKLAKPVDKDEWTMTPPTVNAYANPSFNEVVFPAGILQFPFFDNNADDAINYGGIGMVIGHEMTHLFDDQGRQYDADGNLTDWWTKADADKFKVKAQMVIDQYNQFEPFKGLHVNGSLTLGENLADIGGINLAYEAFKLTKQGQSDEKIDGFTPDQRFFLGFAQVWRLKLRDEAQKQYLNIDPHSPAEYRVNGPLKNFEPFYKAFGITDKDKMFLPQKDRAIIW